MQYRQLGKTGLRISEIGFGTGNTAGLMLRASPEERVRAVERALELGVNYFDTSPDYGKEAAERNLGQALREVGARPRHHDQGRDFCLDIWTTSLGLWSNPWTASMKRLGVDYVDIVEIHNSPAFKHTPDIPPWGWMALSLEDYLDRKGALEGLENARRAGKVGFFGFGAPMESPNRGRLDGVAKYRKLMRELMDIPVVRALFATGKFDLVNVEYNLINPTAGMPTPGYRRGYGLWRYHKSRQQLLCGYRYLQPPRLKGHSRRLRSRGLGTILSWQGVWTMPRYLPHKRLPDPQFSIRVQENRLYRRLPPLQLDASGCHHANRGFPGTEHLEEAAGVSGSDGLTDQEMARVEMVWKANFGLPPRDGLTERKRQSRRGRCSPKRTTSC